MATTKAPLTAHGLRTLPGRWVEAPAVAAASSDGQALAFRLRSNGNSVTVQVVRRDRQGHRVAWASVHSGPLKRKDVELNLADLLPVEGAAQSAGDLLVVRFKAAEGNGTVTVDGLQVAAVGAAHTARNPGSPGPEGLRWPGSGDGCASRDTVLVFGTFDVENYGDLLFPLLAQRRLERAGLSVTAVSPTNAATAFEDAPPPLSIDDVAECNPPGRGVLIGGGNIIHLRPTSLGDYQAAGLQRLAYPALWVGATALAAAYDLPIAWNAPGVPAAKTVWPEKEVFREAASAADYLSVRDRESCETLGSVDRPVAIVPDSAIEISQMWPLDDLRPLACAALESRGFAPDARYVAVHVKQRSLQGPIEQLARELDELSVASERTVALVAVGPCHGDDAIAKRLGDLMSRPAAVFDRPSSLRQVAALIACADLHVGSSLHAYITSFSYGRPGVLIAPPMNAKFQAFTRMVERADDCVADWASALEIARSRLAAQPERTACLSDAMIRQLDEHWDAIVAALSDPQPGRSRRLDFLRSITAISLRQAGWGAILSGLVAPE